MSGRTKIFPFAAAALLSGCSLAPLNSPKTAEPLGGGNWEVEAGLSPTAQAVHVSAARGMTERLDAGLELQMSTHALLGLHGKHTLHGGRGAPWSLAALGGVFTDVSRDFRDKGFYLGPVLSARLGPFTPHLVVRYNYVHWGERDVKVQPSDEKDVFDFFHKERNIHIDGTDLHYLQSTLGVGVEVSESVSVFADLKLISKFSIGDSTEDGMKGGVIPGAGVSWKF